MIGATNAIIVYRSQAEMALDQSAMSGEFFAIFVALLIGFFVFVLCQIVLPRNNSSVMRDWNNRPRFYGNKLVKPTKWRPTNEVIGLVAGAIVGIYVACHMLSKLA